MIFPSHILQIFNKHAGTQSLQDSMLTVPPTLQPTVELPSEVITMGNGGGFPQMQESFILDTLQFSSNASGAIDVSIVQLGPGLWDLNYSVRFSSDDIGHESGVYVKDSRTANVVFLEDFSRISAAGETNVHRLLRLALEATMDLRVSIANTAAGKTTRLRWCILANRLG